MSGLTNLCTSRLILFVTIALHHILLEKWAERKEHADGVEGRLDACMQLKALDLLETRSRLDGGQVRPIKNMESRSVQMRHNFINGIYHSF